MRTTIIGAALAVLAAPIALAADPPRTGSIATAQAQQAPEWNRAGMYVGGVIGYDAAVLEAEGVDFGNDKLMAAAFVGWNWRSQGMVLGVEADWMFTGISTGYSDDEVSLKASTEHIVTLRGRAGIPIGPALIYATAGPAWQQIKLTDGGSSDRTWQLGLAAGAGAEVELTRSLAVRLEALHYVFPDDNSGLMDSENRHTVARTGVVWKLN